MCIRDRPGGPVGARGVRHIRPQLVRCARQIEGPQPFARAAQRAVPGRPRVLLAELRQPHGRPRVEERRLALSHLQEARLYPVTTIHHRTCHLCEASCGIRIAVDAAGAISDAVSYTHLTLPTSDLV